MRSEILSWFGDLGFVFPGYERLHFWWVKDSGPVASFEDIYIIIITIIVTVDSLRSVKLFSSTEELGLCPSKAVGH